jgi:bifunctional UDP-N-acetylglucosamine pyrophosphorylase/glucosamine-1-phosphate N-acetyltransferase
MMKAAILAAGDSTRMRPLSAYVPKHLLPVAGKPLLHHTLRALAEAGIEETLIIYGYRGLQLKENIDAHNWGDMNISYIEQEERKGTAHAASYARDFAGDDDILVMNGDVLVGSGSFPALIEYHKKSDAKMTLSVISMDDPRAYGIVVEEEGQVVNIIEKPSSEELVSSLVNVGVYVAGSELWDAIEKTDVSSRGEYEITDSIRILIKEEGVDACRLPSWWKDIGKPWDLLVANKLLLEETEGQIAGYLEKGAVIQGKVVIEKGATIRAGAYLTGPVYVSTGCVVGPNCYIRPHTYLSPGVKVGNAVEVKNSVIMANSSIGHLSYVGDSVIGRNVNFGAGTITANLRHDDKSVWTTVKGQRMDSGRRKLGAIIGDNVKTGIGTSLAPGVVLNEDSRTGMGVIVDHDVRAGELLIAEQPQQTLKRGQ